MTERPTKHGDYTVHVASSAEECDKLLDRLWPPERMPTVLGFDAEYSAERRVALVQLADRRCAVLVRLCTPGEPPSYFRALPPALERVLACPTCWKAGVGVHDDCAALERQYAMPKRAAACLDLAAVAMAFGVAAGRRSLGDLALSIVGEEKQERAGIGSWARSTVLNERQKQYAAGDARLGLRLADAMYESLRESSSESLESFCRRAERKAAEFVEVHGSEFDRKHRDSAAAKRAAAVPKRAREAMQQRRQHRAASGYYRMRMDDMAKRREKNRRDDDAIAGALQALKQQQQQEQKGEGEEPKSKKRRAGDGRVEDKEDGGGLVLNVI